jgi:hypothetical protein
LSVTSRNKKAEMETVPTAAHATIDVSLAARADPPRAGENPRRIAPSHTARENSDEKV